MGKGPESCGNAPRSPWGPAVLRAWPPCPLLGRDAGGLGGGEGGLLHGKDTRPKQDSGLQTPSLRGCSRNCPRDACSLPSPQGSPGDAGRPLQPPSSLREKLWERGMHLPGRLRRAARLLSVLPLWAGPGWTHHARLCQTTSCPRERKPRSRGKPCTTTGPGLCHGPPA